jgi:phospholipid-translocating ATPase
VKNQINDVLKKYFGIVSNMSGSELKLAEDRRKSTKGKQVYALVIDGASLTHALKKNVSFLFTELACRCDAVICCRVSPKQKAQVVRVIKKKKGVMTLAIGDGANDVSMIQQAHIGVGISGQEGMQAVMASDYAIGQFRFLNRLLLVHGRWSYFRTARMTLLMFYKNFIWTLSLFWFQIYCAFSAQAVFDYLYIMMYNIAFTSLPPFVMGIMDQDVGQDFLMSVPKAYREKRLFSSLRYFLYVLLGVFQSLVCFYITYLSVNDTIIDKRGHTSNIITTGTSVAMYIFF